METKQTNFTLSKEGVFFKPTLKDYNFGLKQTIFFNFKKIGEIRQSLDWDLNQLRKKIAEKKAFAKSEIDMEKREISKKKNGISQEEFEIETRRVESSLRVCAESCKKNEVSQ